MYHSDFIQTNIKLQIFSILYNNNDRIIKQKYLYIVSNSQKCFLSIFLSFENSTSSLMAVKYWTSSFQVWFSSSISEEIFTRAFVYFHSLYIFLPQYKFSRKIYFLFFDKLLFIFDRNIFLNIILFKFM